MFTLIIKHYPETGTRRFFKAIDDKISRINGSIFDMLVGDPKCEGVRTKEA